MPSEKADKIEVFSCPFLAACMNYGQVRGGFVSHKNKFNLAKPMELYREQPVKNIWQIHCLMVENFHLEPC